MRTLAAKHDKLYNSYESNIIENDIYVILY